MKTSITFFDFISSLLPALRTSRSSITIQREFKTTGSFKDHQMDRKSFQSFNFVRNKLQSTSFGLHFFQDIVEKLRPFSLHFQRNLHVPGKFEETKAAVDVLQDVSGDAYNRLLMEISNDVKEGYMVYKEVTSPENNLSTL